MKAPLGSNPKHGLDVLFIRGIHQATVGQVAFLFGGFFGQDMALISVFALDLTCTGEFEPFFCS